MRTTRPLAVLVLGLALSATAVYLPQPASGAQSTHPPTPGQDASAALTDAQIAHIAVTANAIDIEIAELVQSRTTNSAVQAFARTMITDHTAVNEQAAALAAKLGVTPEDNPVSQSLRAGAEEAREQLTGLRGSAFDAAYLEREVAYHQAVLDALDQTLIPEATNAELRGLLVQVRPAIAAHLGHAVGLAGTLGETK